MKKNRFLGCLMLLLAAFFWGSTFVAQSDAATKLPAFTYIAARSYVGSAALLCVIGLRALFRKASGKKGGAVPELPTDAEPKRAFSAKRALIGGTVCGVALTLAAALQQFGIGHGATAGEAGFLTALYMFFVPIFCLILYRRKVGLLYLLGATLTLLGLYFLCIFGKGWSNFGVGHILMLLCAAAYGVHIMFIDRYKDVDGLHLSCMQFAVCAVISTVLALILERPWQYDLPGAWLPIVYAGVFSSAVGFTLQIYGQKFTPPTIATVIMSLESVIALVTEWLCALVGIFGTPFSITVPQMIGCALAFAGIVTAQLSMDQIKKLRFR